MPLSTDDYLLTHIVTAGVVDAEPVAIAIRTIVRASPCGEDPAWSDIALSLGGSSVVQELTIATPWADLVPVVRG
jgi:hypothetical protein